VKVSRPAAVEMHRLAGPQVPVAPTFGPETTVKRASHPRSGRLSVLNTPPRRPLS